MEADWGCRLTSFKKTDSGQSTLLLALLLYSSQLPPVIHGPTSIFSPAGTPAHSIFTLSMLVLAVTCSVFLIVASLLLYAIVRFREGRDKENANLEPPQIYGSNQIELSWTVIPILIVVMLFLASARVIFTTEDAQKPANALDVVVVGHQFWWEYRYPKFGITTANELHVPVSDPAHPEPTFLTLTSADTDHSFWVPRLAGKTDLIPDRVNSMWIDPPSAGIYLGQCAQYCGVQHAKMLIRVYADTPSQFAQWIKDQQAKAVVDPGVEQGREVFEHNACISCHTIDGTVATGTFGPNLTHLASRDTIASGSVINNEKNLRTFIDNPAHFKPGVLMPAMHLNKHDLDAVTAYLMTLK
jgi:cytochrome c oxidase subunit II